MAKRFDHQEQLRRDHEAHSQRLADKLHPVPAAFIDPTETPTVKVAFRPDSAHEPDVQPASGVFVDARDGSRRAKRSRARWTPEVPENAPASLREAEAILKQERVRGLAGLDASEIGEEFKTWPSDAATRGWSAAGFPTAEQMLEELRGMVSAVGNADVEDARHTLVWALDCLAVFNEIRQAAILRLDSLGELDTARELDWNHAQGGR